MAKTTLTAFDARHAYRQTQSDDRGPEKAPELPPSSPVDRPVTPRRSHSLNHGLAAAPPVTTANGPSLVERRASEHSSSIHDATEQFGLHKHDLSDASSANAGRQDAALATAGTSVKPVFKSSQKKPYSSQLPRFKVLLCGDGQDNYSAADIRRFKTTCLTVTGHGIRTTHGVDLRMDKTGPTFTNTHGLHTAINRIRVSCTLEIVFGTCDSEAVISGLDRLLVMERSGDPQEAPSVLSPLNALLKSLFPGSLVPRLDTGATVIVWAAAVDGGPAYPEADLPGRKGKYDVVIGAMCRALESATGGISRRTLFGKIREAVVEYNAARDEKHYSKAKWEQEDARIDGRYRGPQLACLLSSSRQQVGLGTHYNYLFLLICSWLAVGVYPG
ncbi:hypothetical protein V565_078180 [Rhizoctonia solani 123E]|uniref:Uncharacterized protein n=1 Tax=Rhizoctonia solani 123E TaxID=1423351 RepID=A0A074RYZ4_9AGAM|nr:hypothetical protein V565_078180 [Rhizoctonia solani 123E]